MAAAVPSADAGLDDDDIFDVLFPVPIEACGVYSDQATVTVSLTVPDRTDLDRVMTLDQHFAEGDGHAFSGVYLWNSSVGMAHYLLRTYGDTAGSSPTHQRAALELGAGLGLPSLTLASLHGWHVVATDEGESFQHLEAAVVRNGRPANLETVYFDWNEDDPQTLLAHSPLGRFDTILLSDCIFEPEYHGPILRTLRSLGLIVGSQGIAPICYVTYEDRGNEAGFFSQARDAGLTVTEVDVYEDDNTAQAVTTMKITA